MCVSSPHNEPLKSPLHPSLCLQSFSALLFGHIWEGLVSYLFPVALRSHSFFSMILVLTHKKLWWQLWHHAVCVSHRSPRLHETFVNCDADFVEGLDV